MAIEIVVPRLGWSMDKGNFSQWLKNDGEQVNVGDMLFILEGEKADQEVESFDAGILRIPPDAPQPGEEVVVGQLLAYLVEQGEAIPFEVERRDRTWETLPGKVPEEEGQVRASEGVARGSASPQKAPKPSITPRARRIARELGVDWSKIVGSGRNGRIQECDIREAAASVARATPPQRATVPPLSQLTPITGIRRIIADRMLAGVRETAPVTLTTRADATSLVNLRRHFDEQEHAAYPAPSYTDFLVKLTAAALQDHREMLGQWSDDGIVLPVECNISVAVDTDKGLLAPVVLNVPGKSLRQIAEETRQLAKLARDGRLSVQQLQGGTFTITNLGRFGVDTFTPILNLPQAAILGLGSIVAEPVVYEDQIVARKMLPLSLTFDHRVVDGAPAARFLGTLRSYIENPGSWLMP